jgi:peptidoglycan/LPS O-acetylase OafA/YrhL
MEGGETSPAEEPVIEPIDYKFLDGLRGIGAFAVYVNHIMVAFYPWYGKQDLQDGMMHYFPPEWMRNTPFKVLYGGQLWVIVFFILSGFVLPMNFFKTGR